MKASNHNFILNKHYLTRQLKINLDELNNTRFPML